MNHFFHGSGDKAAAAHAPVLFLPEQAGPLQHPQVLGDGRQRDVERLRQPHHRRGAPRQPRQHGPPRGVGQGRKSGAQRSLTILNHVVKYSRPAPLVKQKFRPVFHALICRLHGPRPTIQLLAMHRPSHLKPTLALLSLLEFWFGDKRHRTLGQHPGSSFQIEGLWRSDYFFTRTARTRGLRLCFNTGIKLYREKPRESLDRLARPCDQGNSHILRFGPGARKLQINFICVEHEATQLSGSG